MGRLVRCDNRAFGKPCRSDHRTIGGCQSVHPAIRDV